MRLVRLAGGKFLRRRRSWLRQGRRENELERRIKVEIGKPVRKIEVEPLEDPVPRKETSDPQPVEPERVPIENPDYELV